VTTPPAVALHRLHIAARATSSPFPYTTLFRSPDRDAGVIEELAHVVGVDAVDVEGDGRDPCLWLHRAQGTDPGDLGHTPQQVGGEFGLVSSDLLHTDLG